MIPFFLGSSSPTWRIANEKAIFERASLIWSDMHVSSTALFKDQHRPPNVTWDEFWLSIGRLNGFNYPLYVPLHPKDSGMEVRRGEFLLSHLMVILEDELSVQGRWVNRFGPFWLRLIFENSTDQMKAKLRFEGSVEAIANGV